MSVLYLEAQNYIKDEKRRLEYFIYLIVGMWMLNYLNLLITSF